MNTNIIIDNNISDVVITVFIPMLNKALPKPRSHWFNRERNSVRLVAISEKANSVFEICLRPFSTGYNREIAKKKRLTSAHHAVADVRRDLHALLALLCVEQQVEAAGADLRQLAEHDVLRDALHRVALAVHRRLHQDVHLHKMSSGCPPTQDVIRMSTYTSACQCFHRSATKLRPDLIAFACWTGPAFWAFVLNSVLDLVIRALNCTWFCVVRSLDCARFILHPTLFPT